MLTVSSDWSAHAGLSPHSRSVTQSDVSCCQLPVRFTSTVNIGINYPLKKTTLIMQTYDSGVSRSHEVIVRSADEVFQVIQALCSHVGADFVLFNSNASKLIKH